MRIALTLLIVGAFAPGSGYAGFLNGGERKALAERAHATACIEADHKAEIAGYDDWKAELLRREKAASKDADDRADFDKLLELAADNDHAFSALCRKWAGGPHKDAKIAFGVIVTVIVFSSLVTAQARRDRDAESKDNDKG